MNRIAKISVVIILAIILLSFTELACYIFFNKSSQYFTQNSEKNTLQLNRNTISATYKNFSGAPYIFSHPFSLKKGAGTYRVILLGEAPLSGWPYSSREAVEKKISLNLQKFIPSVKTEIITLSIAGFNSFHFSEMVKELAACNPDMIIVYLGHNEFYGYKSAGFSFSDLFIPGIFTDIFNGIFADNKIPYDSRTDDLEMLLPLQSNDKFFDINSSEYINVIESFRQNVSSAAQYLEEKKILLAFSVLADNNLMPPVGIINTAGGLSADIIYNNARMALLRDGNEMAAEKLFSESKNMDSFRLRIPEDLINSLPVIARQYGADLLNINKEFCRLSQNKFPGDDLFLDYIHPNKKGMDIVSAVYSQYIILSAAGKKTEIDSLLLNQEKMFTPETEENKKLADLRIRRADEMLKKANLSRKLSRASF